VARANPLEYGATYHIYNRGNNRGDLFLEEANYRHFLDLYMRHVGTMVDTFAYCLMRNHFHFLLRIKDEEDLTGLGDLSGLLRPSQRFSNLFNDYAKAINKAYDRTGALFQRPFGRVQVTTEEQFRWLVVYIHRNPEKHGFVGHFEMWPYSSYRALVTHVPTRLKREEVISRLGGRGEFERFHRAQGDEGGMVSLIGSDIDWARSAG
jgi:REP element-mobilizing transposase RayT